MLCCGWATYYRVTLFVNPINHEAIPSSEMREKLPWQEDGARRARRSVIGCSYLRESAEGVEGDE